MTDNLGNSFNGFGLNNEETRVYQDAVKNGGTMIILQGDADKMAQARPIFRQYNGSNITEGNTRNTAQIA